MTDLRTADDAELVARLFHDTYERLAPQFGYETRKASAKPWEEVPENNRRLMVATVSVVLEALSPQPPAETGDDELIAQLREAREAIASLDEGALGMGSCVVDFHDGREEPYPLRDELLARIDEALSRKRKE